MAGSTRIDELRQKFHENPRRYFAPLANEYRKAGDPEQAIAICRAHLAQQPGHMSGHVVYGQALYDARRIEEARGVFEKALALDPDNAIVLKQLGDIAREKGDSAEAKHWYSRAIEADPHDKEVAAYVAELTEPETETVAEPATQPETGLPAEPAPVQAEAPIETVEAPVETLAEVPQEAPAEAEAHVAPEVPAPITPEIAPQEIEMVAEVPSLVEQAPEPAPAAEMEEAAAPAEDDVAWRTTPPHEESPFVTRTMAELYAKQGYREAALDVYRQLALHHPDDKEIFDRIEALEKDSASETPAAAPEKPKLSELPFEPIISDLASEPEPEVVKDFSEPAVYGAEAEDDEFVSSVPRKNAPHFTETEIGGDTWDTDAWGAGFTSDDEVEVEFDAPDIPEAETEPSAPPTPEPVEPQVAQLDPQPVEAEPIELDSSMVEPVATESTVPEPVAREEEPEAVASLPEVPVAREEEKEAAWEEEEREEERAEAKEEPVAAEPAFVAYSPQPPAAGDLPHFAPKGPTVREFFATLGSFRPSARAGSSITAHAALTPGPSQPETDFPLATDAFSSLFGDSPVSEDDSRAAFALSGALGTATAEPATPTPPKPAPAVEAPAAAATAQESEEDIRRFREWLDGLQES